MSEGHGEDGARPEWTRVRRRPTASELIRQMAELEASQDADQRRLDEDQLLAVAIGAVVQEQRLWLCWSQDRLAAESGVSVKTLWRVEGGSGEMPSLKTLGKIAKGLQLERSELLQKAEELLEESSAQEPSEPHEEAPALALH